MTDPSSLKSDPVQHHDVSDWRVAPSTGWGFVSYAAGKVAIAFDREVLCHRVPDPLADDITKHIAIGSSHADQFSKAVEASLRQDERWQAVIDLLGNPQAPYLAGTRLGHSPVYAHIAAQQGLPYSALFFLLDHAKALNEHSFAHVLDISVRTLHRQRTKAEQAMPVSIGSKTLQLAETIALAQDVFGSREEAERWLQREAMGLDGHRPIDLLATPQGASMVLQFLERLQYGVYT